MLKIEVEKRLALIASGGSAGVTLLVTDRVSTEPVNVGKMVLLAIVAFASFSLILPRLQSHVKENKLLSISGSIFLIFGLISIFLSSNSWVKGFYGTFGRNTGFLTYLSLFLLLFAFAICRREQSFTRLIWALYLAGIVNILVSIVDLMGGRVFTWDNPFGNVIGTFGNTNFISSFLGIFVSTLAALALKPGVSVSTRIFVVFMMILGVFVTIQTKSLQGLVIIAVGVSVVAYFYISSRFKKSFLNAAFLVGAAFSATLGVLGMLQIGPLKEILYKPSVSFRGEYWASGLRMGLDNLVSGVGFDSYGTYYRFYRDSSAIVSPGVNVSTDTAHNVFIDVFAGIGLVGFIGYLVILILVLRSALKIIRRDQSFDFIFVALFTAWTTYQVQSFISINQIGLAVWGWILGGAIIGYSKMEIEISPTDIAKKIQNKASLKRLQTAELPAGTMLLVVGFSAIGLFISIPPFLADAKMRSAVSSNDSERVANVAKSWPLDSLRLNRAAIAFANAGINATAIEMSKVSTNSFPEDFLGWYALYQLTSPSDVNREVYLKKLHEIDPLNPEFMGPK